LTDNLIEKIRQFLAKNTYCIVCRTLKKYVLNPCDSECDLNCCLGNYYRLRVRMLDRVGEVVERAIHFHLLKL
jgi:hypothetical protein